MKRNILIVEDEENFRDVIGSLLKTLGYTIHKAEDGLQALKMIEERSFDLILSDIGMPKMNGFDLLRKLREAENEIPFIFITGFELEDVQPFAKNYRANGLLHKPFLLAELKQLLDNVFCD